MMENKQLILVAIRGNHTQIVHGEAAPGIIATQKASMIKSGNWIGWKFQMRNKDAYKNLKILQPKIKKAKKFNPYD